jgi:hypothetical protein
VFSLNLYSLQIRNQIFFIFIQHFPYTLHIQKSCFCLWLRTLRRNRCLNMILPDLTCCRSGRLWARILEHGFNHWGRVNSFHLVNFLVPDVPVRIGKELFGRGMQLLERLSHDSLLQYIVPFVQVKRDFIWTLPQVLQQFVELVVWEFVFQQL